MKSTTHREIKVVVNAKFGCRSAFSPDSVLSHSFAVGNVIVIYAAQSTYVRDRER